MPTCKTKEVYITTRSISWDDIVSEPASSTECSRKNVVITSVMWAAKQYERCSSPATFVHSREPGRDGVSEQTLAGDDRTPRWMNLGIFLILE